MTPSAAGAGPSLRPLPAQGCGASANAMQGARMAASPLAGCSFEIELLRLFAKGKTSSFPTMALLGGLAAAVAAVWAGLEPALIWFLLYRCALGLACRAAARFLDAGDSVDDPGPWRRKFLSIEALLGTVWAFWLVSVPGNQAAQGYALVLLLLAGAMNVTACAALPSAMAFALTPMTLAALALLQPTSLSGHTLPLAILACAIQLYFMILARKLCLATIEALSFKAEKDELIAELEQAKASSDLARHRAEAANLAKSRFLAAMSHELRTPLNAILGFSEVMKGELFGAHAVESYKEYSNDIHASGQHLLMLINEILDLSRIEAGRFDLKEEVIMLEGAVAECRRLLSLRAKKRQITIAEAVEPDLPGVWADRLAVRQIILNLLSNAIKFTPQGGMIKIKIGWTANGGQYVSLRDTGPGIPEHEIPTVLSSFGRGAEAQKNAEEGSGLGLPIAKGLAELHGGTLALKSKTGEGTEVIVIMPPERVLGPSSAAGQEDQGSKSARHSFRRWLRLLERPGAAIW